MNTQLAEQTPSSVGKYDMGLLHLQNGESKF